MSESLHLVVRFLCLTSPRPPSLLLWAQVPQVHLYNKFHGGSPQLHRAPRVWREPLGGRASPLRPAPGNEAMASRTQHSPAEHTEHDQHFEQAELFTILKVLSEVCPGQTSVLALSQTNSFLHCEVLCFVFVCFFLEYSMFGFGKNFQYLIIIDFYLQTNRSTDFSSTRAHPSLM